MPFYFVVWSEKPKIFKNDDVFSLFFTHVQYRDISVFRCYSVDKQFLETANVEEERFKNENCSD